MSNTEENFKEPSDRQLLFSAIGIIGFILIFVLILIIAYVPNRPEKVDLNRAAERSALLAENKAKQRNLASTYSWVNKEEEIVRIPLEVAKSLIVSEYKDNREVKPSSSDAPSPANNEASSMN